MRGSVRCLVHHPCQQLCADVVALPPEGPNSVDFNLSYSLLSPYIIGTLIKETQVFTEQKKEQGTFVLFVTPPTPDTVQAYFMRNIIFLLDRSGSMTGEPYTEAVRGLEAALSTYASRNSVLQPLHTPCSLQPSRHGSLQHLLVRPPPELLAERSGASVARVDPERAQLGSQQPSCRVRPLLLPASSYSLSLSLWVCSGTTDIATPMTWALDLLNKAYNPQVCCVSPRALAHVAVWQVLCLPFVFLLTDGAVENERQICM